MGIATLRCEQCLCDQRELDAHRPESNASVFESVDFRVLEAHRPGCEVVLQVLARTSSGKHKFKVRFVTFSARMREDNQSSTRL